MNILHSFKTVCLSAMIICGSAHLAAQSFTLSHLGTYETGIFDEGASEIVDYHAGTQLLFSTNADANTVDAIDISDPASPTLAFTIDLSPYGDGVNSVAVLSTGIAIAVEADPKQDPGVIAFFDHAGNFINQITAGALPDMVTATPDESLLLVANEGEPDDDYLVDPIGSVSIIDLTGGLASLSAADVTTLDFTAYDGVGIPGARIFGPGASVAQDMEPEYIAVSPDNTKAWVVCQENNVLARIDLASKTWDAVTAMGTKDHSLVENALDASNDDDAINITTWPVQGYYLPDAIDAYMTGGHHYVVLANEGDSRDYDGFGEEERVKDVILDPTVFPDAASLQEDENLGRLKITNTAGDIDNDGDYDVLYSYGARSFSIRNAMGELVYDSGDDFEQITADALPFDFNSSNDENDGFDNRSDDKGPEPEAVEIAEIGGEYFAFIGLERVGGIMVYNITDPTSPQFVQYLNIRDFSNDLEDNGSDSGVECIKFISAADSPTGTALIVASNEVSGSVSVFGVNDMPYTLQVLHASDLEGGVEAIGRAKDFAAIVDHLEDEVENTVILSAGDNYIPGPFYNASSDASMRPVFQSVYQDLLGDPSLTNVREGVGRADITIMNIIGFDASAVGNHEFDAGSGAFASIVADEVRPGPDVRWIGARFPYLSANLDFSDDADLSGLHTSSILSNTDFALDADFSNAGAAKFAPATTIMRNGEIIGVVGATTQVLESISSPGGVQVLGPTMNDMPALAAILQPSINYLRVQGVNKIILVSHLQQFALEQALVGLLHGVDIIIAGGSDTILADANDELESGDIAAGDYPFASTNADGEPALLVSTDGEYSYVGRLVVDFDVHGVIIPSSLDDVVNGIYVASTSKVEELWGDDDAFALGTKGELVQRLTDAVQAVVIAKDGNIFGKTDVFLNGERAFVRTEETNLGNLSADANLAYAQSVDPEVLVSHKNGGGIRASIGEVVETSPGVFEFLPPQANPLSGKQEKEVSQLDIENSLRFNNGLSLITLTAEQLLEVLNYAVAASDPGATPGQFAQVGGVSFSFDPSLPAGTRVRNAALVDADGNTTQILAIDGSVYGDADRAIRMVTLNFLAGGGDGYPFADFESLDPLFFNRVDLTEGEFTGAATFAEDGSEQDALAEYLAANHSTTPYAQAETPVEEDLRIQNLDLRPDEVLENEDCSAFNTAPVELTKSLQPVPWPVGMVDRVQLKWYKDFGQVRYSAADNAACDIQFWAKKSIDEEGMHHPLPELEQDTTLYPYTMVKKSNGNEMFKWPVKFRFANGQNPVQPNTSYRWRVRCYCNHGLSTDEFGEQIVTPWSEVSSFNTPNFDPLTGEYYEPMDKGNNGSGKSIAATGISLQPNPTSGLVYLSATSAEFTYRIMDVEGRLITSEQVNGSRGVADLSGFQDGVYLFEITTSQERIMERVVLSH